MCVNFHSSIIKNCCPYLKWGQQFLKRMTMPYGVVRWYGMTTECIIWATEEMVNTGITGIISASGWLFQTIQPEPIMINPENDWSVEDPFIWYQEDRYYALVKDFQGYFTRKENGSVALFESMDGIKWSPAKNPCAFERRILWEDGITENFLRLEQPQLYIENGKPIVLLCAATNDEKGIDAFNVQIPLRQYV